MVAATFTFAACPAIRFGPGSARELAEQITPFGRSILLVTGARSLNATGALDGLRDGLAGAAIDTRQVTIGGEPSPEWVDETVAAMRGSPVDAVVAVGGGSVIDAGKAISAMLLEEGSVVDFLEGVGTGRVHSGRKVPMLAVPTTAGTGSEATKNAVLSRVGAGGFKKSLRHERFVPDVALVDPELMLTCPPGVTAACGLDAFTQLLEAYLSTKASPLTDALAWSGLKAVAPNLIPACTDGADAIEIRTAMAYGALVSGIVLANAGLGLVHGLASPCGAAVPIPHGVVCGTFLAAVTEITIEKLHRRHGPHHPALCKYARLGIMMERGGASGRVPAGEVTTGCRMLVDRLWQWTEFLNLPRLSHFGLGAGDLEAIAAAASNKNNPIPLGPEAIQEVLRTRL